MTRFKLIFMITIQFNGQKKSIEEKVSLAMLLLEYGISQEKAGIACCINLEVIHRSEWQKTFLENLDKIEVLNAVAGG